MKRELGFDPICAYCNGAFTQEKSGYETINLQIHNNWLFYPFHRWYIYFYERILGSLINDPTFALPYWNWDNPDGLAIPAMFEEALPNPNPPDPTNPGNSNPKFNPLFDAYRNSLNFNLPPGIVNFARIPSGDPAVVTEQNLFTMYNQMMTNSNKNGFFGGEMSAGEKGVTEAGSIEAGVHTSVHAWVGNGRMGNNCGLGNFLLGAGKACIKKVLLSNCLQDLMELHQGYLGNSLIEKQLLQTICIENE
ncbi:polyphenol oxidase I, chloroplastic-like protein [Tanacetum coccineum]